MSKNNITSTANPRVKNTVKLRQRKHRFDSGLTLVEGVREMTRAVEAGVPFQEVFICRELLGRLSKKYVKEASGRNISDLYRSLKVPVHETSKRVFTKMAYGDRAEGILGVCKPNPISFQDLLIKEEQLYVVVEDVEKPGNLGAILRTCDGAGVDGVIICDEKIDLFNPNVVRASLGTLFSLKVLVSSVKTALEYLSANKVKICAAAPSAKKIYTDANLTGRLAIVVGSEQRGLSRIWTDKADLLVRIPMKGHADSLNVSASTAVLLYEAIRQRSR